EYYCQMYDSNIWVF
nr:immunoglobulin light chain junction region [Macaca mulatta]